MSICIHQGWPSMTTKPINTPLLTHPKSRTDVFLLVSSRRGAMCSRTCGVRASTVNSHDGPSASSFAKRMEQAWLISQQPRPVSCTRCNSDRIVECEWCCGTGFFMLGDSMLCQVPSRSTTCVICSGKGSRCCPDCKGTGFRAKWLEEPRIHKE